MFRYFTPATVEKMCEVLIQADRWLDLTEPFSLKRNVLGILINYYIDYPNARGCWRLIQELLRMFDEEDNT